MCVCVCVMYHMWEKMRRHLTHRRLQYEPVLLGKTSSLCRALLLVSRGRRVHRHDRSRAGTMPPFRGPRPAIVHSSLHCSPPLPSHAPFATHTRPAGTEMAAPLTRFTIPPPVHATIGGHGHRHLYGSRGDAGASQAGGAASASVMCCYLSALS